MSLDLTGIQNIGEFYSHHYLDALLDNDLKGLFECWRDEDSATPDKRLEGCAADYFKAKSRALNLHRPELRYDASHNIHVTLLQALGYDYHLDVNYLADGSTLPTLSTIDHSGHAYLWLAETTFTDSDTSPLDNHLLKEQYPAHEADAAANRPRDTWEAVVGQIFRVEQPPRWLLLFAGRFVYLIDRTKWGQGQYLLFDLDEIFGRRQRDALRAAAALLSRDALAPGDGLPIHDTLDENSHKHAYGVSGDLKYGVRLAVERLANEYVWYQTNIGKKAVYSDEKLAQELTHECLTYLYRLLFLFYAEARSSELGLVPMKDDSYRKGYSLEALRDLEQVPLYTPQAQNGYFLNESLNQLFKLVNEGYPDVMRQMGLAEANRPVYDDYGFTISGLQSPLFDREATPRLASAKFRNSVLQEVIQLLSLSKVTRRRNSQRGRISYAQLGINQLGAVYEGLLSYSGFFAQETLYEVKPAGTADADDTGQTYFIPESDLARYQEDEFVYETEDGQRRRKRYPKGRFIFRLAGRDREKSASYYTPEVLTECVVKYSLKELLGEAPDAENWKSADEILQLTICEPAMGSGAFINEAINQLADAYLQRKQAETGQQIAVDQYHRERQKVKAHLALHNAYGVDLNPMAAELAQVSIWLNSIYPGMPAPWFEARLAVGNSLIGARRQVYSAEDVLNSSYTDKAPTAAPLHGKANGIAPRPKGSVYHWLLPDKGMAAFDSDKVIKELAPTEVQAIKAWRTEFTKKINKAELKQMQTLSDAADDLWQRHTRDRQAMLERTHTAIDLWGQPKSSSFTLHPSSLSVSDKRTELDRLNRPTSPYRRLKLAMDYWCALWFWPIPEAAKLPSRADFLADMAALLIGPQHEFERPAEQLGLMTNPDTPRQSHLAEAALVHVDALTKSNKRLTAVATAQQQTRFYHWELAFTELFHKRGGFDLIVGNPPWVKVTWNEAGFLSDFDSLIAIRNISASDVAKNRKTILQKNERGVQKYIQAYLETTGTSIFLNSTQNYNLLQGVQTNLYKCFIFQAWFLLAQVEGIIGFLHPIALFDDPKGKSLRVEAYKRLKFHFQFQNELKLFADVGNQFKFSVNVYASNPQEQPKFYSISNLFHPFTIDNSFNHDGLGEIPGIKNLNANWDIRGHTSRIIEVDKDKLSIYAQTFDSDETKPIESRFPIIHSVQLVKVLSRFSNAQPRLNHFTNEFTYSEMFHETEAQREGLFKRETVFAETPEEWVISGPHFFVSNPFYQTPNENCRSHRDYSSNNLVDLPDNYMPRTNYVFLPKFYKSKKYVQVWKNRPITDYYRLILSVMLSPAGERTLQSCLIPPGPCHINNVRSLIFDSSEMTVYLCGLFSSICYDFWLKITGKARLSNEMMNLFPVPNLPYARLLIVYRTLRLNCLTNHFENLWKDLYEPDMKNEGWTKDDQRLSSWSNLTAQWEREIALRNDYERRLALIEIDVLSAFSLDLSLDELLTIYRIQFPVMIKYEKRLLFDQRGYVVPVKTISGQFGVDESHPDFASMVPPFTAVDREADYRQAWAHFEKRLAAEKETAVP